MNEWVSFHSNFLTASKNSFQILASRLHVNQFSAHIFSCFSQSTFKAKSNSQQMPFLNCNPVPSHTCMRRLSQHSTFTSGYQYWSKMKKIKIKVYSRKIRNSNNPFNTTWNINWNDRGDHTTGGPLVDTTASTQNKATQSPGTVLQTCDSTAGWLHLEVCPCEDEHTQIDEHTSRVKYSQTWHSKEVSGSILEGKDVKDHIC